MLAGDTVGLNKITKLIFFFLTVELFSESWDFHTGSSASLSEVILRIENVDFSMSFSND